MVALRASALRVAVLLSLMLTASIASAQTQIADQTLTREGGAQTVDVSGNFVDTGGPLTYTATSADTTIVFVDFVDAARGFLTITPVAAGTSVITVTAQEGSNTPASQMFTVTVGDSATTTTQIGNRRLTIEAGAQTVTVSGSFIDPDVPDARDLTFTASSRTEATATVMISRGELTITPLAVGTSVITVTAREGSNTAASQTFTVTVVRDSATTFTQIADQTLTIVGGDHLLSLLAFFADPDAPGALDLIFTATSGTEAAATIVLDLTGVLAITPVAVGRSVITVTAREGSNAPASQTFTVTVTAAPDLTPTTFTQIDGQTLTILGGVETVDVSGNFADPDVPDSADLTFTASSGTLATARVDISAVGVLTITPLMVGTTTITVTAQDRNNPSVSQRFTVTVGDSDTVTTPIPDRLLTLAEGDDIFDASVHFNDADVPNSEDLNYRVISSSNPAVATVVISATGTITITPLAVGRSVIRLGVREDDNSESIKDFTVIVGNSATTFTQIDGLSLSLSAGSHIVAASASFADADVPDSTDLTFTVSSGTPATATVRLGRTGGTIIITPVAVGTSVITVTAREGSNTAASQTFTVRVRGADSPTTIVSRNSDQSLTIVGGTRTFNVSGNFADPDVPDSADLIFTATSGTEATATVMISATGAITITPLAVGTTIITVTAQDGSNPSVSQTFTVTVGDSATTSTPLDVQSLSLAGGPQTVDVSGNFADPDGNPLTYGATSATPATATVAIDAAGILTITPLAAGTSEITVTAQDGSNTAASQMFTVTVRPTATTTRSANIEPVGLPIITGPAVKGETLILLTKDISDADGLGVFRYQWQSAGNDDVYTDIGSESTSAEFVITQAQVGKTIRVILSYTDDGSTPENRISLPTMVVSSTLGNDGFEITSFPVFPNPTTDILNITLSEKADYTLLNIRGQTLKKGVLDTGKNKINISFLAKGIYLLNIKTNKGSFTEKVVKN